MVHRRGEISRFFDGLDMVDPGLVQVDRWHRPRRPSVRGVERLIPIYAAVARKPLASGGRCGSEEQVEAVVD